jgi:DNA-binding NarL/FixJ family response regulator
MFKIIIYEDRCFECGSTENIQKHHVVPKIKGGTKKIPLCVKCHSKVHNKDFVKFHSLAKIGRERAIKNGVKMGRPENSIETLEIFMGKPKNLEIANLLKRGWTIRKINKELKCSSKTVLKVKRNLVK